MATNADTATDTAETFGLANLTAVQSRMKRTICVNLLPDAPPLPRPCPRSIMRLGH